ncbi:MAG: biotin synthase BioB [Nitrospinaceae bacterium]
MPTAAATVPPLMQTEFIHQVVGKGLAGEGISREEALALETLTGAELELLFEGTNRIREKFHGRNVKICSIVNAKSGACPEVCGFCAQASSFSTDSPEYPLMSADAIVAKAKEAEAFGSNEFSIVTSGTAVTDAGELEILKEAIRRIKAETRIEVCCSLGLMSTRHLKELKAAGLDRFHHNLETAASHFNQVVATHAFSDEVQAVRNAQEAGLPVCVGGIFGMGETFAQRVELALDIRDLETDSFPVNFLKPIAGTPLEHLGLIQEQEALRAIALLRLVNPQLDMFICGGREEVFGDNQEKVFAAGANGILGGDYLTTKGRDPKSDIEMIERLGLVPILETMS